MHAKPLSAPCRRAVALSTVTALHALALAGLLTAAPEGQSAFETAPVMVEFIAPPKPEPPRPQPTEPPKPRPVVQRIERPLIPPPVITAPAEAPSPVLAPPPPPPAPPAPIEAPPAPPAAAPPAPAPLIPPVFNADYLDNPAPAYPAASRRSGEQGRVVLRVLVNATGGAEEVQVRTSSGFARLDEAARETVRRWKFVPARRGSDNVAAWVLIPISFRLEG